METYTFGKILQLNGLGTSHPFRVKEVLFH